ncbi:MAG: hypothetical protein QCI82_12285, partial [Candidatus Thermoplasmatota archaeon]|nr:hypothetical protein [Candidatus Thermoplasmatota archaeon]
DGYKPISGTGSVNALEETEIDLSRSPLTREVEAKMILYLILFVIMILIVIGIAIFLFTRKKKEEPEEEKENTEDPSVEDKEADPSSERSMPLGSPELTPPPPVLDEEKPEDGPALEEEGSESIDDLLKDFYPDPEQIEEER